MAVGGDVRRRDAIRDDPVPRLALTLSLPSDARPEPDEELVEHGGPRPAGFGVAVHVLVEHADEAGVELLPFGGGLGPRDYYFNAMKEAAARADPPRLRARRHLMIVLALFCVCAIAQADL